MNYFGSCLCGKIKYELIGKFDSFFFCHCKSCRKDTGSAHASNLFSSTAKLNWLSGETEVKTFDFNNSGHIKSFCPNCGSALPNIQMDGKMIVVPAGSLDSDIDVEPTGHIYLSEKANWDEGLERFPHFDTLPNEN